MALENDPKNPVTQLRAIMRRLRDPASGCPWDVEQTFKTIAPFTIEEAYEVADAIERNDLQDLQDELGDLLFQVVFHAQMAEEQGAFTFDDVAQSIVDKMIRRHPHVFGDQVFNNEAELKAAWEAIKREERALKAARRPDTSENDSSAQSPSALDGVAGNLPSLKRADKIQKRAARVGFDWSHIAPVWEKLDEEIAEVKEAIELGEQQAVEDELGDVLFTLVNLARHCNEDSEAILQRASAKFERRFRQVELLAQARAQHMTEMDLQSLDLLWDEAKRG